MIGNLEAFALPLWYWFLLTFTCGLSLGGWLGVRGMSRMITERRFRVAMRRWLRMSREAR